LEHDCFSADPEPISIEAALARIRERLVPVAGRETVALASALDRVLAEDVVAPVSVPPHDNAAVDGYALRAADLSAEGETRLPVAGRVAAGHPLATAVPAGHAVRIFTGAPVPPGLDTVAMQEACRADAGAVMVPAGVGAGANLRRAGEDLRAGDTVLDAGAVLGPAAIGLAASIGRTALTVRARLRVALASTGDEVTEPGEALVPGGLYDANRYTTGALLRRLGCAVTDLGILPDDPAAIAEALIGAARNHDVVVTSGGVSGGEEDHVRAAVAGHGRIDAWRLAVKPGRPVALGVIEGTAFIGLPGNPVAAVVAFVMLARPILLALGGAAHDPFPRIRVTVAFDHAKKPGRREFVRVRLDGDPPVAHKAGPDGSAMLSALAAADGLIDLDAASTGLEIGDTVPYLPFSEVM
jgi:molybdopterin molybdotransferase